MTSQVDVVGVGMHPFGRFPNSSLKDLARVAVVRALADAGLGIADIQAVYSANAMAGLLQGQEQIRGQATLRDVGIERVPIVNVENACASGSSAFREACIAVRAGVADTVLAVGFEKMFVDDRDKSLAALESAADLDVIGGLGLQFTAVYALRLRKRLDDGSLTLSDLAQAAVKSHRNGSLNPNAQHRKPVTEEEVLASRPIAEPLTLLMCSSIADGAAAVVVSKAGLHPVGDRPRIAVRASAAGSGFTTTGAAETANSTLVAERAYAEAGIGPQDINLAEVHDAMAPGELLYYEQLGFCAPGGAADLLRSGMTQIEGRIPVNTSGGLSSRGHPVGATGLGQICEVSWQLRGEAGARQVKRPRFGMAQNSGGWLEGESAATNVHILERLSAWD
jgi:acetyl-CoA acetyltransferase